MARPKTTLDSVFVRIGVSLTVLGVAAISVGVMFGQWRSDTTGQQFTDGEVVALRSHRSRGQNLAPVVNYVADGVEYEVVSGTYSNPPLYSVGEKVRIVYSADTPESGRMHSFFENWFWPIIIMLVGVILCTIGVGFCWISLRKPGLPGQPVLQSQSDLAELAALAQSTW